MNVRFLALALLSQVATAQEPVIYSCEYLNHKGLTNKQTLTFIPASDSYVGYQDFVNDNKTVDEPLTFGHAKQVNGQLIFTEQVEFATEDLTYLKVVDVETLDYAEYSILAGIQSSLLVGRCTIP